MNGQQCIRWGADDVVRIEDAEQSNIQKHIGHPDCFTSLCEEMFEGPQILVPADSFIVEEYDPCCLRCRERYLSIVNAQVLTPRRFITQGDIDRIAREMESLVGALRLLPMHEAPTSEEYSRRATIVTDVLTNGVLATLRGVEDAIQIENIALGLGIGHAAARLHLQAMRQLSSSAHIALSGDGTPFPYE